MKPCSAWCRKEEGIHVWMEGVRRANGGKATFEEVYKDYMGELFVITEEANMDKVCVPIGTFVRVIDVQPVSDEVPPNPDFDIQVIETVKVVQ